MNRHPSMFIASICLLAAAACSSSAPAAAVSPVKATGLHMNGDGTGDYMSNAFTSTGSWELDWTYACSKVTNGHDWLIVAIYRQSDSNPGTAPLFDSIHPIGGGSGVQPETGATATGIFYFKVSSECDWHLFAKPVSS